MKILRRILLGLTVVCGLAFLAFLITYIANENYKNHYYVGEYAKSYLNLTGFSEGHVYPYNIGDSYYQMGDYQKAEECYRQALDKKPPKEDNVDCKVRVNLALSMVYQLDFTAVTKNNVLDYLKVLYEARDILLLKECATNQDDGHYGPAQTLKNEIDKLIEELENLFEEEETTPPPPEQSDPGNSNESESETESGNETETDDANETESEEESGGEGETESEEESGGENESQTESESGGEGESQTETQTESSGGSETQTETQTAQPDTRTELEKLLESIQDAANGDRYGGMDGQFDYNWGYQGPVW